VFHYSLDVSSVFELRKIRFELRGAHSVAVKKTQVTLGTAPRRDPSKDCPIWTIKACSWGPLQRGLHEYTFNHTWRNAKATPTSKMDAQVRHRRKVVDETMLRKLVVMGFDRETDGSHSNKERVRDYTQKPFNFK